MNKKVDIDAGHGGKDSGAAANGILEKDIALKVSKGIATRLNSEYEGVTATLTRDDDKYLELKERTDKSNKLGADVFVSVHCNAGGGSGGFESYTYSGVTDPATTALQNMLHTEIINRLKQFNVNDRGQKKKDLYVCGKSNMPAVLTENLFIDVAADANKLKRTDVIEAIIDGHVAGVAKYLGLKQKEAAKAKQLVIYANNKAIGNAEAKDGVTVVPLRLVAEALGAKVNYDAINARIDITL